MKRHVLLAALLAFVLPARAEPVPVALERLVPEDPLLVAYAPSLSEVEGEVLGLLSAMGLREESEGGSVFDLLGSFSEDLADLELVMDASRPFAAVLRLPGGMPMPLFVMTVPLRDGLTAADVEAQLGVTPLAVQDGYAAIGSDPTYAPGGARQAMLAGMGDDDIAVRLDVEGLFVALGPMVDMMVQMALQTTDEAGAPTGADPARIDEIMGLVQMVRDGIGTLEISADLDDGRVELAGGVRFRVDGPLALGPQPALDSVWADAGYLDPDAAALMVSSLDLRNVKPLLDAMLGMFNGMPGLQDGPAAGLASIQEPLMQLWDLTLHPFVAAIEFSDAGLAGRSVMGAADAGRMQAGFRSMFSALEPMGLVAEWAPARKVAGFDVETVDARLDLDRLADFDDETDAMSTEEREAVEAMIAKILTPMSIAANGERVVFAMDRDAAAVDAFLADVAAGERGDVPARLAAARAWAGDDVHGVMTVDATAYMQFVAAMMPAGEEDMASFRAIADAMPSAPLFGYSLVERDWLRGRLSVEQDALVAFVRSMRALDTN